MNKFVDDKGLKRYTDNMKLLLKKKVSKKMKSQVIIGRAIKPKACEIGGMENWYAFAGKPTINLPKGVVDVKEVYTRSNLSNYLPVKSYLMHNGVIDLFDVYNNYMYRVDKYEINEANLLSIWLTYKENAVIQRGTASWMEINNGRKYNLRKKLTPNVIANIIFNLKFGNFNEGHSRTKVQHIVLERFGLRYKNKHSRDLYSGNKKLSRKLKWGKLRFVVNTNTPNGPKRLIHMCGKYRIRLLNMKNAYMSPITFFIKGNGNIII